MSLALPALARALADLERAPFEVQARVLRAVRRELADYESEQDIEDSRYLPQADVARRMGIAPSRLRNWLMRHPELRELGRGIEGRALENGEPPRFRVLDVRQWAQSHGNRI